MEELRYERVNCCDKIVFEIVEILHGTLDRDAEAHAHGDRESFRDGCQNVVESLYEEGTVLIPAEVVIVLARVADDGIKRLII